jgi:hypothetical protein
LPVMVWFYSSWKRYSCLNVAEFLKEGKLPEARKAFSDLLYNEKFKSQALGLVGLGMNFILRMTQV